MHDVLAMQGTQHSLDALLFPFSTFPALQSVISGEYYSDRRSLIQIECLGDIEPYNSVHVGAHSRITRGGDALITNPLCPLCSSAIPTWVAELSK